MLPILFILALTNFWGKLFLNKYCQPEHPESGPIPDAGVEVPDEEESGDVAADDACRGELHRVGEAVVTGQRVQQEARVAVRHFPVLFI